MTTLSLNAPVPNAVVALADDLSPLLSPFDDVREDHSLVVKRLTTNDGGDEGVSSDPLHVRERLRTLLADLPPVRARITGLDAFEHPPVGPAPVLYLAVESPGIVRIHESLLQAFPPVADIEGDGYTPHVTVARGGDVTSTTLDRLRERSVPSVEWTVDRLLVHDATYGRVAAELSLPL